MTTGAVQRALLAWAAFAAIGAFADTPTLRFYTWDDYIDPAVIAEFEANHHVNVREFYFHSDTERDRALAESDGHGYDLIVLNGGQVERYAKQGWILPLDPKAQPNLAHVGGEWRRAHVGSMTDAAPILWGAIGIVYRPDLVAAPIESWFDLLRPAPAICGRIMMGSDARELTSIALKALGYSINTQDLAAYRAAEQLLMSQRNCVLSYDYPVVTKDSQMLTGRVAAAMTYSGDAMQMQRVDPSLRFVLPKEGSFLWVDYLAVLKSSPNAALAFALIDFLLETNNAARISQFANCGSTNASAEKRLESTRGSDSSGYPSIEWRKSMEFEQSLPPALARERNLIYAKLVR